MKRSTLISIFVLALMALSQVADAQVLNPAVANSVKAKKIYRGSTMTYENVFSLRSLDAGAELSYAPYYAQSLTLSPQIWLRDDMFVSGRISLEVELTDSQWTDYKREPVLSDTFFNYMWLSAYTIPKAKISISPTVRLRLPSSKISQAQSMVLSIEPGLLFSRSFKLRKGKWFTGLTLMYGFRFSPRFHQYQTAQVDQDRCSAGGGSIDSLSGPLPPECVHSGIRNSKYRFTNSFVVRLNAHPKLFITASVALINDLLYEGKETTITDATGREIVIPATDNNHNALVSSSITATVPFLDWLYFSAGFSSFHNQLEPDSSYQVWFFNRNLNFFFDLTIPIDKVVEKFEG